MVAPTESRRDDGFTLIELLVSSVLIVLVLAIVGGMIAGISRTSKTVSSMTGASTSAQTTAESIERGIRNSSDFLLTNPTGTDQLLIARTAQTGSTLSWMCTAWYYSSANGGSIRFSTSSSAITAPTASALAHWTLLATGLTPASGSSVFAASTSQLTIGFNSTSTGGAPVAISSTVVSRAGSSGTPACY